MEKKHGQIAIEDNKLLPLPFKYSEPPTLIYFTCPEGTSLCPRSGFPDFWTAHIWYTPKDLIVELKTLKLYLNKFRNEGHYHEELAHILLNDLKSALSPQYLKIVMDYTRRGNIQTDVQVEWKSPNYQGPTAPEWAVRYGLR